MPTDLERIVEVLQKANPGLSDKTAEFLARDILWSPLTAKELQKDQLENWHDPDFVVTKQRAIVARNVKHRGMFYVIFAEGEHEGESYFTNDFRKLEEENTFIQETIDKGVDLNVLAEDIWYERQTVAAYHLAIELAKPSYTRLGIVEDLRRGDSFCVSVLKSPVCSCVDVSFMKIEKDHLC